MERTITYNRRGGGAALRTGLALVVCLLLIHQRALPQQSSQPDTNSTTTSTTTAPSISGAALNVDSLVTWLTSARGTADSATRIRIDSQIRALIPPPDPLRFRGLRAVPDLTRGVIAGCLITVQLNRAPIGIPNVVLTNIDTSARMDTLRLVPIEVVDSSLVVRAPLARGNYRVNVFSDRDPRTNFVDYPHQLHIESLWVVIGVALLPLGLLLALLIVILRKYRDPVDNKHHAWLGLLLLEPQNHTYSLSRAQFVFWMAILSFSYVFLFVAQGLVAGIWEFPPLTGFAWTFIISLGTLVAAQATTTVKGAKGAGQIHPALNDLFVHGGVVALERVQQVLWNFIAAGLFLFILIKNYASSAALPTIPDQLLYLMGISSAGYLTGKAIRKPGPIINQVNLSADGSMLVIQGKNLSNNAFIWVDGVQLTGNAAPLARDPDAAPEFSAQIQIAPPPGIASTADWYGAPHSVIVVNADGQRAEWDSVPAIVSVEFPSGAGNDTLTVTTQYVSPSSTWMVDNKSLQLVQVTGTPNSWTYQYPAASIPASVTNLAVTSSGRTVTYPVVMPGQGGGGSAAGGGSVSAG